MSERESAVVLYSSQTKLLSVRYRERGWLGWSSWKTVASVAGHIAWGLDTAQAIADGCLENGVVPGAYNHIVHPIIKRELE